MSQTQLIQAHCNTCGGSRNHKLLKEVSKSWVTPTSEQYSVWSKSEYCLLECAGCEMVRLRHQTWFSEETDEDGQPLIN